MAPDDVPEPIAVALAFVEILERIGVAYLIGGSFASSVHGEPRSTNDLDVLADFRVSHVAPFLAALGDAYYASEEAIRGAIGLGGTFNVIHIFSAMKVDVFLAGEDPFNAERLSVRQAVRLAPPPAPTVYVDIAEHSVLRKLEWYRRGGEVSDRQWRDVVSILRTQGTRLDATRLERWAIQLGVSDLLVRTMAEASTSEPRP